LQNARRFPPCQNQGLCGNEERDNHAESRPGSPDQNARSERRFASVEEAARQLIDEALTERAFDESDDLAWAKPYVDEALAESGARGEEITLEEHKAHNAAGLAALRTQWRASLIVAPSADAMAPWNILRIPACLN
jgi:antitoxin ParD1/3/4